MAAQDLYNLYNPLFFGVLSWYSLPDFPYIKLLKTLYYKVSSWGSEPNKGSGWHVPTQKKFLLSL